MNQHRPLLLPAEVALACVTASVVLGMHRLFDGGGWLGPLLVQVVTAHALVALARRREVGLVLSGVVTAVAAVLLATWTWYRSTTFLGVPTAATWQAMQTDLADGWTAYHDVVAPTPPLTGFLLATAFALWGIAFVADWAAFRLWVPTESILPAGTMFVFVALLGTEEGRYGAVMTYATAVLGFMLLHRLLTRTATSHWVADRGRTGQQALLGAGAALGLAAVVAGSIIGPSLPGADAAGVLDPRDIGRGEDPLVVISPMVDLRTRLVDQQDVEVFTVESPEPAYWRLTALDHFDGRIWRSSYSYERADDELGATGQAPEAPDIVEQTFTIGRLAAIWLPAAFEPRSVDVDGARYDEGSATLIVDEDDSTSDGLTYRVTSSVPRATGDELRASTGEVPADILEQHTKLDQALHPRVQALAEEITRHAETPFDKALALEEHLRSEGGFTYDTEVEAGHSNDDLARFVLDTKRGYCEQFAGAFAAMARGVGLPARVAVGFTWGDQDPEAPTRYSVRGGNAHAWPEVYLPGAGWLAFEPTPGRGNPAAEAYTGVPPRQADPSDPNGSVGGPAPDVTLPTVPPTAPDASTPELPGEDFLATSGDAFDDRSADPGLASRVVGRVVAVVPYLAAALAGYLVVVPLGVAWRRWRRRRRATDPAAQVRVAWAEAVEAAGLVGVVIRPTDTYDEASGRLRAALPEAASEVTAMARVLEAADYSEGGVDDHTASSAISAGSRVVAAARTRAGAGAKVRAFLDPRRLVSAPAGHVRPRTRITPSDGTLRSGDATLVGVGDQR